MSQRLSASWAIQVVGRSTAGSFEFVLHCLAGVSVGHEVQRDLSQAVCADGCLELAGV
ncbi:hypothetical protein FRC0141_02358 [Corynebacterium diphtheriae]|nr:hypothetical protein FRC0024_00221 [Corynebacterium diphtheriae]CAB0717564.1 hypothetical protein FRC0049_02305 [Corynebacterium diphtheriae]CAB0717859.1 hypothetical protein FRC0050_02322 [Corynebacterium diphtheriae]CAB0742970.1 hypothetical protein FRC0101_02214 [Corynebacterium diphtheriae]CAB0763017.1 hypothetical protein FRC0119_02230 [Corynebacterium diphtheriae]